MFIYAVKDSAMQNGEWGASSTLLYMKNDHWHVSSVYMPGIDDVTPGSLLNLDAILVSKEEFEEKLTTINDLKKEIEVEKSSAQYALTAERIILNDRIRQLDENLTDQVPYMDFVIFCFYSHCPADAYSIIMGIGIDGSRACSI